MNGVFFGDKAAIKNISVPVDYDDWIASLMGRSSATAWESAWFRAIVYKRAGGVRSIPRQLKRVSGNDVLDEEATLPFRVDIADLMYRASMALDTGGAAYWAIVQNARGKPLEVRWLDPKTIETVNDHQTGKLLGFVRRINGVATMRYPYDENTRTAPGLGWVWTPGMNETGPGDHLLNACTNAARVMVLGDEVMRGLLERGAINQYWVTAEVMPGEQERERVVEKIKRTLFGGADNAHNVEVFAQGLTPTKIGTDPKDLTLGETNARLQAEMCAVSETPAILLDPTQASNRSVIDRATQTWITSTIKPHAQMIVDALNFHVLNPAGYDLSLNTAAMDVDQEEEASKAAAWAMYVDRGVDPVTAAAMLGIDIPEGLPFVVQAPTPEPLMENTAPPVDDGNDSGNVKAIELKRLEKFVKNGTWLARRFHSDVLTPDEIDAAIVSSQWQGYP